MSKGEVGEQLTSEQLSIGLDESLYHYYHNIIVPFKNGSSQIDHLVVSPFGLFIVETKNLAGWIYGASDKAKWTQVLYKTKHQFQNPLRQTFRQKKVPASYFGVQEKNIHPIINFVGDCTFRRTKCYSQDCYLSATSLVGGCKMLPPSKAELIQAEPSRAEPG